MKMVSLCFLAVIPQIFIQQQKWKEGAKIGIYPPIVLGSFLISRLSEPEYKLSVYVLCREIPGFTSSSDVITWKEVTI